MKPSDVRVGDTLIWDRRPVAGGGSYRVCVVKVGRQRVTVDVPTKFGSARQVVSSAHLRPVPRA